MCALNYVMIGGSEGKGIFRDKQKRGVFKSLSMP